MKARLGYVSIALSLEEIDHFRTITWTAFTKLDEKAKKEKLHDIIQHNLQFFETTLKYNLQNEIFFYRMSQNMIPLATHPMYSYDYITPYQRQWKKLGNFIKKNHMRVDMHPDQYCVLNSTKIEVIHQTMATLSFCHRIFQALSIKGKVILHVGSSVLGKEDSIERFIHTFETLDKEIQQMILLENDDKVYNVKDVLELCERLKIPMVLDYHHALCNPTKEKLTTFLPRIFATWNKETLPPKIHFSSPKSRKEKRAHHTYLSYDGFQKMIKTISPYVEEVDIMLECKGKEEALFRLVRQLKMDSSYTFLCNTIWETKKM